MYHRSWITALGNVAYAGELPPELGIPFKNQLDAETDRLWLKAYQDAKRQDGAAQQDLVDSSAGAADFGEGTSSGGLDSAGGAGSGGAGSGRPKKLRRAALAAQAFVRMMENGGGKGKANRADMVVVCDLRAYRRGHAHHGEPCHIIGGGPIPVSLAKELGRDAFVKAVLHDGTEIHTIAHFGRRYPAVLQTALELGAPPEFNGNVCAAPGCDRCYHLQRDHIDPVANGGLTSYANNQLLCPPTTGSRPNRTAKPASSAARNPGPQTPSGQPDLIFHSPQTLRLLH